MNIKNIISNHIYREVHIAPLVVFRIFFGLMMFISTIRFMLNGWITDLYVTPSFFFTYYGFDWVRPLNETGMYTLFILMAIFSLLIMVGGFYRISSISFFLLFTYVELIDKTNYLNHYYFVSLISFLMIWMPAGKFFSLDQKRKPEKSIEYIPVGFINMIRLQLAAVYFFAGIAKINYDWLFRAQPMSMWLSSAVQKPVIGFIFRYKITAMIFSWAGMIYDISIPFLLSYRRTRFLSYFAVIIFHLMTWYLFPIGMFPWIMIFSTTIFFSEKWHRNLLGKMGAVFNKRSVKVISAQMTSISKLNIAVFSIFLILQVTIPFRYLLYPGNLFWTEQGYRFSWRVMLMEKAGYVTFDVTDEHTGKTIKVFPYQYLTPQQEKMMSTQPDMILQFAHFLAEEYQDVFEEPKVTANSFVTLNGRPNRQYINDTVNLANIERGWHNKDWIKSYE